LSIYEELILRRIDDPLVKLKRIKHNNAIAITIKDCVQSFKLIRDDDDNAIDT
jgi:hypothetical protein